MELIPFTVKTREAAGKGPAGRARHAGDIPGVVYGDGKDNVSVKVDKKSFDHLVHGAQGEHSLVDLNVDDDNKLNGPAMMKEVQHHPISGAVLHFDLMRIDLKKKIQTRVPIRLVGHSVGVIAGGVLDHHMREVDIECLPLDVPLDIVGDITNLKIGESFHVSDLTVDEAITVLTDSTRPVAAIQQPRVAKDKRGKKGEAEK